MDMTAQKRFGISAAALKWLAVVTMVIDHFALAVYRWLPNYDYNVYFVLRKVGRLAFPIYCFLLVEGFFHTKNVAKYFRNCFLFAVISELPLIWQSLAKWSIPRGRMCILHSVLACVR